MDVKTTAAAFVEDLLRRGLIPVHHVAPPYGAALPGLDLGPMLPGGPGRHAAQACWEAAEPDTIYHVLDALGCSHTILRLPDSEELLVCGPVRLGSGRFPAQALRERLHLSERSIAALQEHYLQIPIFHQPMAYYDLFATLGAYLYGPDRCTVVDRDLSDLEHWYEIYRNGQREDGEEHAPPEHQAAEAWYAAETDLMNAFFSGSKADIQAVLSKLQGLSLPPIFGDERRDARTCLLMLDTLLRKVAEISGVPSALTAPCSSQHIRSIGEVEDAAEMHVLLMRSVRDYYVMCRERTLKGRSRLTQKVVAHIDQDITAELSLSTISEQLHVNAKYLSALFKRDMGVTLTDYINQGRIELAKRLLLTTDLPIKTIAQKCGIPDIHYFSHQFKKRTGHTPKDFRQVRPELSSFRGDPQGPG